MTEEKKSLIDKALEIAFGKPKAHKIGYRPNRKERRTRIAIRRKQLAAMKRLKHEGRGRK